MSAPGRPAAAGCAEAFVHRAAAEAREIQRDVLVAEIAQPRDDAVAVLDNHRDVGEFHLDARDIAVVPHAELAHPEPAEKCFRRAELVQRFHRHGRAVRNARREARHRGLVPGR